MFSNITENDEEIARALNEEYQKASERRHDSKRSQSSQVLSKTHMQLQIDLDAEIAFILQIEEISLSENKINSQTTQVTDEQVEKTHEDMTNGLRPDSESSFVSRALGMFTTMQMRYNDCQTKNQELIKQIQSIATKLLPLLFSFKKTGGTDMTKAQIPLLAIGIIANLLQGKIDMNEATQILSSISRIWNESGVWYEFFEQLVYILVSITFPAFAQRAMGKVMAKITL